MARRFQSPPRWDRLVRLAEQEVADLLSRLPAPLAQGARAVPVVYRPRPGAELMEDGLEEDLLGLFVGLTYRDFDSGAQDLPAQILLFLENLWTFCEGDAELYREEVARTYLHELGHYLGLDEDELAERELD